MLQNAIFDRWCAEEFVPLLKEVIESDQRGHEAGRGRLCDRYAASRAFAVPDHGVARAVGGDDLVINGKTKACATIIYGDASFSGQRVLHMARWR